MSLSTQATILVADDDTHFLTALAARLREQGFATVTATKKSELEHHLRAAEPELLLLSLRLGEFDGVEILRELLQRYPALTVIMLAGSTSLERAGLALRLGAYDYLIKPPDLQHLRVVINHALEKRRLLREVARLETLLASDPLTRSLWGESAAMVELRQRLRSVASIETPVLLLGEPGVGKQLAARAIHELSDRRNGPFVIVNLAALPRPLVEKTLFGQEDRGQLEGNPAQRGGCETAAGGTLYLEAIADLERDLQAKLLRLLDARTFQRAGSDGIQTSNARVVAAAQSDLGEQVRAGQFREDLHERLRAVAIAIPPLRERRQDIPLLAGRFLEQARTRYGKPVEGFTRGAVSALMEYDWPGNIRQLENLIERLVIHARESEIHREAVLIELTRGIPQPSPVAIIPLVGSGERPNVRAMDQLERQAIIEALRTVDGNVKAAASLLGLGQATIYRKIKRYNIAL